MNQTTGIAKVTGASQTLMNLEYPQGATLTNTLRPLGLEPRTICLVNSLQDKEIAKAKSSCQLG
jgi:hypothetical protein